MTSNYQTQQRPKLSKTCSKCGKEFNVISQFSDSRCYECRALLREQEAKTEKAMWESYCPFCHMLLAEHKQNEAQLCLFNLRGYLTKVTNSQTTSEADGQ